MNFDLSRESICRPENETEGLYHGECPSHRQCRRSLPDLMLGFVNKRQPRSRVRGRISPLWLIVRETVAVESCARAATSLMFMVAHSMACSATTIESRRIRLAGTEDFTSCSEDG